ncbi:CAAX protease self-immunity [Abditibacterium utsteinense]|uniref:CAAX protease self-immunity n=1 Tax=Abditibacterium utsteinense TaxID=1960156 RepID=A0A2S8SP37_9BACT|nr:CPBP family intramembrane glutamic endopeptidase [Abditibacterium utsteinense]PQV62557.1 CAAX protease self-immunity [Abditibacterium utsteinense]
MTPETPSEIAAATKNQAAYIVLEAPYIEPTWEDDETRSTLVLRALFTILSAGFLAYSQWRAPENWIGAIGQNWGRWVWTSALCNFILPLGIVWMFFGQGLTHQAWLKNQKHNAWNYGWNFKAWKRHLKIALACWLVFLPFLIYFSRQSEMRLAYATYLPPVTNARDWLFLISTLTLYMFCWEWFFRGFSLFGIAQGLGFIPAIALQAILFGFAHMGKPPVEMGSAFAGGLVLGTLAWREKSFFPAFLIHALIHVSWAVLVLI